MKRILTHLLIYVTLFAISIRSFAVTYGTMSAQETVEYMKEHPEATTIAGIDVKVVFVDDGRDGKMYVVRTTKSPKTLLSKFKVKYEKTGYTYFDIIHTGSIMTDKGYVTIYEFPDGQGWNAREFANRPKDYIVIDIGDKGYLEMFVKRESNEKFVRAFENRQ